MQRSRGGNPNIKESRSCNQELDRVRGNCRRWRLQSGMHDIFYHWEHHNVKPMLNAFLVPQSSLLIFLLLFHPHCSNGESSRTTSFNSCLLVCLCSEKNPLRMYILIVFDLVVYITHCEKATGKQHESTLEYHSVVKSVSSLHISQALILP